MRRTPYQRLKIICGKKGQKIIKSTYNPHLQVDLLFKTICFDKICAMVHTTMHSIENFSIKLCDEQTNGRTKGKITSPFVFYPEPINPGNPTLQEEFKILHTQTKCIFKFCHHSKNCGGGGELCKITFTFETLDGIEMHQFRDRPEDINVWTITFWVGTLIWGLAKHQVIIWCVVNLDSKKKQITYKKSGTKEFPLIGNQLDDSYLMNIISDGIMLWYIKW